MIACRGRILGLNITGACGRSSFDAQTLFGLAESVLPAASCFDVVEASCLYFILLLASFARRLSPFAGLAGALDTLSAHRRRLTLFVNIFALGLAVRTNYLTATQRHELIGVACGAACPTYVILSILGLLEFGPVHRKVLLAGRARRACTGGLGATLSSAR